MQFIFLPSLVEFTATTRLDQTVTDGLSCDIRRFVTALRPPTRSSESAFTVISRETLLRHLALCDTHTHNEVSQSFACLQSFYNFAKLSTRVENGSCFSSDERFVMFRR